MKKENKVSMWMFGASLVFYVISMITVVIPGMIYSTDKIFMYLGFSFFCLGLCFLEKSKKKDDMTDK